MANFTPISAAIGGGLIGLSAVMLMLSIGRIAGISGIFGGLLDFSGEEKGWRVAFIVGLILAPLIAGLIGHEMPSPQMPASWAIIIAAGLLVGFGTRLGAVAPPATASAEWRGYPFAPSHQPPSSWWLQSQPSRSPATCSGFESC